MTSRLGVVNRSRSGSPLLLVLLAVTPVPEGVTGVAAQAAATDQEAWEVPRTPDGRPDLQGNWTNSTLTRFEREEGRGPVFTQEEVEDLERGTDECPPSPGTIACGRPPAQPSGDGSLSNEAALRGQEYSEFYWDRGSRVAVVNGEHRASLVTRPSDGHRPPLTPEGQRRVDERRAFRAQFAQYDHPELRPLGERCIVSFGTSAGPPMIPNYAYNNNYTIVQTADHIMIMTEMVHDVRIIRLGEPSPLPEHITPWFGDSWGRWDGDVLVVETTNLHPGHPFRGIDPTEHTKVTERFTRVDEDSILYEFTIEDPSTYAEPWGGEIPFERFDDRLYEYACHEGNYALSAVLSGARYQESNR